MLFPVLGWVFLAALVAVCDAAAFQPSDSIGAVQPHDDGHLYAYDGLVGSELCFEGPNASALLIEIFSSSADATLLGLPFQQDVVTDASFQSETGSAESLICGEVHVYYAAVPAGAGYSYRWSTQRQERIFIRHTQILVNSFGQWEVVTTPLLVSQVESVMSALKYSISKVTATDSATLAASLLERGLGSEHPVLVTLCDGQAYSLDRREEGVRFVKPAAERRVQVLGCRLLSPSKKATGRLKFRSIDKISKKEKKGKKERKPEDHPESGDPTKCPYYGILHH